MDSKYNIRVRNINKTRQRVIHGSWNDRNARVRNDNWNKIPETNLRKLRGDESYITAAERIKGMYAPNSGMPGLELSQLMDGIDYGGVQVTGLDFNREQGFDNPFWYEDTWDGYGKIQESEHSR